MAVRGSVTDKILLQITAALNDFVRNFIQWLLDWLRPVHFKLGNDKLINNDLMIYFSICFVEFDWLEHILLTNVMVLD